VFVDNGLLRQNEALQVMQTFSNKLHIHVVAVDASDRFLDALRGITEPELKRKTIGRIFVDVFQEVADSLGEFAFLGQGTLYTDVIESGTGTAQTIKSHHNVGGLPKHMKFKLIEPLNQLFKDEVRQLGITLGLAPELVWRQPFPGPGLAIRIIGAVTAEKLLKVRLADTILREEIAAYHYEDQVWQYFTVLPGIKSVGVMGDQRSYDEVMVLRAITSVDGMTADWARLPYDLVDRISRRIVNEVAGINRVVLDVTSKPPATIEWE
jgi:GMP synthase (glutamine-hydrolysing)